MKRAGAAILAVTAVLLAANMLGVAVAEAPTTTPVRTVSVQGVSILPIAANANASAATNVYREAMAGAVTDGQSKAGFLTGKVSATLGAPINVIEDGGYINCTSSGGESEYAEYEGEQPDFGVARGPSVTTSSPESASGHAAPLSSAVVRAKRPRRKHKVTAKKASATGCKLTAQVSLTYTIG